MAWQWAIPWREVDIVGKEPERFSCKYISSSQVLRTFPWVLIHRFSCFCNGNYDDYLTALGLMLMEGAGGRSIIALLEASPITPAQGWMELQMLPCLLRWESTFSLPAPSSVLCIFLMCVDAICN